MSTANKKKQRIRNRKSDKVINRKKMTQAIGKRQQKLGVAEGLCSQAIEVNDQCGCMLYDSSLTVSLKYPFRSFVRAA